MAILAALFAALAIFVVIYTLATPGRPKAVSSRLDKFDRGNEHDREAMLSTPFMSRVGVPVLGKFQGGLSRFLPQRIVGGIETRLIQAGEPISVQTFLTVQIAAIFVAVLVVVFGLGRGATGWGLVAVVGGAGLIGIAPIYWLRIKVATRKRAILKALPDAVDLIVTTVEAGLSIDAALAEVGHETRGPLGEELRLTVRETTLGRSRRDALVRMIDRTQVPELRTFVQSIIQAEQTGIPIGQVLRTQAAQIRLKKRQAAEAEAQRAPIKMIVVLVLCVLPAMLLCVMGPAIMRMNDSDLF